MNLKLDLSEIKKYLPLLQRIQPFVVGLALIGVFAYTAYVVNGALNVKPSETPLAVDPKHPATTKITFDKNTIEAVKKLNVVQGDVPVGGLGKDDPFK
jgi:hypothetical protein